MKIRLAIASVALALGFASAASADPPAQDGAAAKGYSEEG